jgi:hypothetical protein
MDTQQLKLLAGHVRALLAQSNRTIGHSQSLDVIAALPGLRNWPEVQAFPQRVAACSLDLESTGRLSNRLRRKFDLGIPAQELLSALRPATTDADALHIWPAGPRAGIYVTADAGVLQALLAQYEDATDGGIVYAERAGNSWPASIDLGEYGLWSEGLDRVPSGTLVVVGPVELNQQAWSGTRERLQQAANLVLNNGHRIAVLIDTPVPETLFQDVALLLSPKNDDDDFHMALRGAVDVTGELVVRSPFAPAWPLPRPIRSTVGPDALASNVRAPIEQALERHTAKGQTTGILLLGSTDLGVEHPGMNLVEAILAMTQQAGPAARVIPRFRSTPAKDWLVPDDIKQLPFLPSIESAIAQGYRRIIFPSGYTSAEELLEFADDALLISSAHADSLGAVYLRAITSKGRFEDLHLALRHVIAVLCQTVIENDHTIHTACDLYADTGAAFEPVYGFSEAYEILEARRIVRWEDEMDRLIDAGEVTRDLLKSQMPRQRAVLRYLAQQRSKTSV